MFEQTFKNIDDVLWKEAGCTTELDYTEQTSWTLFLKYLDDLERGETDATERVSARCPIARACRNANRRYRVFQRITAATSRLSPERDNHRSHVRHDCQQRAQAGHQSPAPDNAERWCIAAAASHQRMGGQLFTYDV